MSNTYRGNSMVGVILSKKYIEKVEYFLLIKKSEAHTIHNLFYVIYVL